MSTPMGFVYPTSFCTPEERKEVMKQTEKKQVEKANIDIKFETSLDNLFKSTIKLYVQEAEEEEETNESETPLTSQPQQTKNIGKLDINFKGRRNKADTELKKVREPVKDVKQELDLKKLNIIFDKIGDSFSDSAEEESPYNNLSMAKTNTEAPKAGNVRPAHLKVLKKSATIRQSEQNLQTKMKHKFMKHSLNYYGNNSDEEYNGPRRLGEIYLTMSRLL